MMSQPYLPTLKNASFASGQEAKNNTFNRRNSLQAPDRLGQRNSLGPHNSGYKQTYKGQLHVLQQAVNNHVAVSKVRISGAVESPLGHAKRAFAFSPMRG